MARLSVVTDISGSMSVLGKKNIVASLKQTLDFYSKFDSDLELEYSDWSGNDVVISCEPEKILVLTDGLSLEEKIPCDGKRLAVVLCGADCNLNLRRKLKDDVRAKAFYANEILNAIEFLLEDRK